MDLDTKPQYVSIESEKVSFQKLLDEIELLEKIGFKEFIAVQQKDIHKKRIQVKSVDGNTFLYQFSKGASGVFGKDICGKWKSKEKILEDYRQIFSNYAKYGDNTFWFKNRLGRAALKLLSILKVTKSPGWYDTHARFPQE